MTYCSMYIGDLSDPSFAWDGGDWNGNLPARISPIFPPAREHYNKAFHDWVLLSGVEYKQTDFDGWVAVTTKRQLEDFIAFCYLSDSSYTNSNLTLRHEERQSLVEQLDEIRSFVTGLSDTKEYALVAEAF